MSAPTRRQGWRGRRGTGRRPDDHASASLRVVDPASRRVQDDARLVGGLASAEGVGMGRSFARWGGLVAAAVLLAAGPASGAGQDAPRVTRARQATGFDL